jgi:hypothetical protein
MVNITIVNEHCPVRDRMLVEQGKPSCISRELPTVFQVSDGASRELLGGDCVSTDIFRLYETAIIKVLFHNRLIRMERLTKNCHC